MDAKLPSRPDRQDQDYPSPWYVPSGSNVPEWPSESWSDPMEERALFRRRLRRFRFGFSALGLALVVASLSTIGTLILIFSRQQQFGAVFGVPHWQLIEGALITWVSLLGVCVLWGRWPDANWQRRSGILLLMCLVDAILWTLRHAGELGLHEGEFGHEWFRESLGAALGWSEFALIATLAADIASHQGEPQASDLAKAVRSMATTGAMVWFLYFYFRTDWNPPLWPLRQRGMNHGTLMLYLSWIVIGAINLVQVTALSLLAGRCCGRTLREMARADKASEALPSRSEVGWEEFKRDSRPKGGA
jgi:hypothetical protein